MRAPALGRDVELPGQLPQAIARVGLHRDNDTHGRWDAESSARNPPIIGAA